MNRAATTGEITTRLERTLGGVKGYCACGPGFVGDLGVAGGGDGGG